MAQAITITVDDDRVLAALRNVENGIEDLIDRVADELAGNVATEAGQRSTRLGAPWEVEGAGPDERHVVAPEFFAHFLAGGTQAHGPARASRLVFAVDGKMVFARHVSGITADHFDERAIKKTESRVDDLMRDVIARAT